ncbi:MAG: hypothetical protein KAQ92_03070 [Candidatus Aenigmarchaeota archaeon]|nr:hypothetical protein [Candidatus Aenigmarchaeota archaeon]
MDMDTLVLMKQQMFELGNVKEINRINKMIKLRTKHEMKLRKNSAK